MNSNIGLALFTMIMILLYIFNVGLLLVNILKNDVKNVVEGIIKLAGEYLNAIRSHNTSSRKLNYLKECIESKLVKLNETFTTLLKNITKITSSYMGYLNRSINNTSIVQNNSIRRPKS